MYWVTLQEANSVAELDIEAWVIKTIVALGFKDHSVIGNELDASNRDSGINIRNWPVKGMYMPDAISSYGYNGKTYYITANEGDSRDNAGFSEEARVADLVLAPGVFPTDIQNEENLGRLNITTTLGTTTDCGDPLVTECYNALCSYGARSFSIWSADGQRVFDNRSDDKGPEGIAFVSATDSPNGKPMLVVGNEISGTTTLYGIDVLELTAN